MPNIVLKPLEGHMPNTLLKPSQHISGPAKWNETTAREEEGIKHALFSSISNLQLEEEVHKVRKRPTWLLSTHIMRVQYQNFRVKQTWLLMR
jgi:hypothetical protein